MDKHEGRHLTSMWTKHNTDIGTFHNNSSPFQNFIMKFPFSPELTFDYYYNTYNDNFITFDNAFKDSPEIKFYTHYKLNRKTLELQFHKTSRKVIKFRFFRKFLKII